MWIRGFQRQRHADTEDYDCQGLVCSKALDWTVIGEYHVVNLHEGQGDWPESPEYLFSTCWDLLFKIKSSQTLTCISSQYGLQHQISLIFLLPGID